MSGSKTPKTSTDTQLISANDWEIRAGAMRGQLLIWGRENYQEFPWRSALNPYQVLIAEIMLHRTRAAQVVPVYIEFLDQYPTIKDVASASVSELEEMLRSLGLLWRVEKLNKLAQMIMAEFDGRIPDNFEDLTLLPGVSHYIANAVLCFGWGKPTAIVDTNTLRILARIFGLTVTDSTRRTKAIHSLMADVLDQDRPVDFNYAMLDLAHQVCLPKVPLCHECPILEVPCRFGTMQASGEAAS